MWDVESAPEWLLEKLSIESYEKIIQIALLLWGIWFSRNQSIWENKSLSPEAAIQ